MRKFLLLLACQIFVSILPAQTSGPKDIQAIRKVLHEQELAWNRGDIPAFMEGYWKSDSLVFMGAKGITKGWTQTLEGYKKRYPDRTAMGTLQFDILSVTKTDKKSAFVTGKWHLSRTIGDIGGYFSLVWRKIKGQWVIIADHTS